MPNNEVDQTRDCYSIFIDEVLRKLFCDMIDIVESDEWKWVPVEEHRDLMELYAHLEHRFNKLVFETSDRVAVLDVRIQHLKSLIEDAASRGQQARKLLRLVADD